MYNVQFPGLGISFTINPVAFSIGNYVVKWYGVIIAVGFLLAFLYTMRSCKKFRMDEDKFIDAVILGIVGGVVGARLYYVLFDASNQFVTNPISVLYIWQGGLGIYGGIIGGLLCGALVAKLHKISVLAVLDMASLGFLIGQCIGRWGNFVNQEAFGGETSLPWGMVSEETQRVATGPVHPCFLYESLWCLLGFILLHIFSRRLRRYDGQVFLLYVVWYGVGRFFIEGLRTDSLITPYLPIRVSQLVAAASVVAAVVLLIVFRRRTVLTGCGHPRVMELNNIVEEIPAEDIEADGGPSTIFDNPEDAARALAEAQSKGEDSAEDSAEEGAAENPAEPSEEKTGEEKTPEAPAAETEPEQEKTESEENR